MKHVVAILSVGLLVLSMTTPLPAQSGCPPTRPDAEGPFYEPNAPRRGAIGSGFVVEGVVRSTKGCDAIAGARIEWWQANPRGEYDDQHRATMESRDGGAYRFQTSFPPPYAGRPSHIHVKVSAPGHRQLTTQLYPKPGQSEIKADFVVVPE